MDFTSVMDLLSLFEMLKTVTMKDFTLINQNMDLSHPRANYNWPLDKYRSTSENFAHQIPFHEIIMTALNLHFYFK